MDNGMVAAIFGTQQIFYKFEVKNDCLSTNSDYEITKSRVLIN